MGGTYPGKRVPTARRSRSGRAGNGDRLQAEGQVIDVRRDPHYARSRREAPRSLCTLASLRPLRAGEGAYDRGFRGCLSSRRPRCTLRSLCTLASLRSLGSGCPDPRGALSALRSLGSGCPDPGGALRTLRSLGSG
jgi:hypothetical protein